MLLHLVTRPHSLQLTSMQTSLLRTRDRSPSRARPRPLVEDRLGAPESCLKLQQRLRRSSEEGPPPQSWRGGPPNSAGQGVREAAVTNIPEFDKVAARAFFLEVMNLPADGRNIKAHHEFNLSRGRCSLKW